VVAVLQRIGIGQQQQLQQHGFSAATPTYNQQASSSVFALPVCIVSF